MHPLFPVLRDRISADKDGALRAFLSGSLPYIPNLAPESALALPHREVLELVRQRLGGDLLRFAMKRHYRVPSPVLRHTDDAWLHRQPIQEIHLGQLDSFWQIVPLSFTEDYHSSGMALRGIWEVENGKANQGLVSWNIRSDRFCEALAETNPKLKSPERQLVVVLNLLHAMGKTVGFRLPPQLEPFGESVLANPHLFSWQESGRNPTASAGRKVQRLVFDWLWQQGSAHGHDTLPEDRPSFFSGRQSEKARLQLLFGKKKEPLLRQKRRHLLMRHLLRYELAPANPYAFPPSSETVDHFISYLAKKLRSLLRRYPFDFCLYPERRPTGPARLPFFPEQIPPSLLAPIRQQVPFFGAC